MLLAAAKLFGAGGVAVGVVSALDANSLNAVGVFLGGLAALLSAVVALVALLRRPDPTKIFAEGVKYGQGHGGEDDDDPPPPRRRRRRK